MQNTATWCNIILSVLHALCDLSSAVGVSDKLHVTWLTDKTQFLSCIYDFAIIWLLARRLITRYRSKLPQQFQIEEREPARGICAEQYRFSFDMPPTSLTHSDCHFSVSSIKFGSRELSRLIVLSPKFWLDFKFFKTKNTSRLTIRDFY